MNIKSKKNNIHSRQDADLATKYLKTLANSNRLMILSQLLDGECCVGDLEKILHISQSAISQHLSKMHEVGIISRYRNRQQIIYKINDGYGRKMLKFIFKLFNNNIKM